MAEYEVTVRASAVKYVYQTFKVEAQDEEAAAGAARRLATRASDASWDAGAVDFIEVGDDLENDYAVEEL